MEKYGVQVQKGKMADSAEKAFDLAQWIKKDSKFSPCDLCKRTCRCGVVSSPSFGSCFFADKDAELILKAQIHAGGRGKGHFDNGYKGGVKIFNQ
jgi:succinyl-CoA synthetase beta subunit